MLARGVTPVVPSQGSVGASGDLAPLAHMAAAMIGVGEASRRATGSRLPRDALAEAGLAPLALGPKEGLALLNGTQFSTANALAGLFEAETLFRAALVTGALSTEAAGAPTRRSIRASMPCAAIAGQIEAAAALRALMPGRRSAPRISSATSACRTPTACAASRR